MPIILNNITYTYMENSTLAYTALKDVGLTVNEGEFLGIIGHTGSGKSTLIMHMNGLLQPNAGSVTVDGLDMKEKKSRREGRMKIGMVFQYPEHQLFEETVYKDISFGPKNMGLSLEEIDFRVKESMELVGLIFDKFAERSPFELSGGEKRRAALAGIIAMRPKYLILDEPMAGLDPRGRRDVLDTILKLKSALNCAVVMVSHSMDDMARAADRIAVLNKGMLAKIGSPQEIFTDTKALNDMKLDVPQAVKIAELLRAHKIDVPMSIYDMDALYEFLIGRLELC
ncbi:MAG: energy-coupling factor transporter ATPase [Clostridia bacterium]